MNDVAYSASGTIRVRVDPEIMRELVGEGDGDAKDEKGRERQRSLREYQVYRLMRSIVTEFNQRAKGRRERFKLVEDGDGLFLEFGNA